MINEDRLVKLFKDLCLINAPALEEREVVKFVKNHLQTWGWRFMRTTRAS